MVTRRSPELIAVLILILLSTSIAGISQATSAVTYETTVKQPIEIKLQREGAGKARTVKVRVGEKSYPFLFDSGGGTTIISPEIAKEIGCQPGGRQVGFRATGERMEGPFCQKVEISIGGYTTRVDAGVFNIMSLFDDKTPIMGGIISFHTFEGQMITMDIPDDTLTIETAASFTMRIDGMSSVKSRLSRQAGGATLDIFVAANTPGGTSWIELDSGNFGPVFLAPHTARQLGLDLYAPNRARATKPAKLDMVGLIARERDIIYDGLLNFDTVNKFVFAIDLNTGKTWARQFVRASQ